jgi:hypothetical protein
MLLWAKSRVGRLIESAAWALDAWIGFGLVSGAAVAVALGKFAVGGVLAVVAVGVFLRFKRRRKSKVRGGGEREL